MMVYISLFIISLLAATILPFSSEVVLLGYLSSGTYSVFWLVIVATVGNVTGAVINWYLGHFLHRFSNKKWFPASAKDIERASHTFNHYGQWSLLLAWVPIIGDPLTVVAGFLKVKFLPFLMLVAIGKAARYVFISWWFW